MRFPETTSGPERRLTVGVPADRVDSAVKRLQDAAAMSGFLASVPARCP